MSVAHDPPNLAMFLFSAVFMDTAATIPTGALAERWRFASFVAYGLFMSMILYPVFANWVWGGGWLGSLGAYFGMGHGMVDFAGSSVVHMTGGVTALAGVLIIGPRIGKFRKDGTISMIQGHNLPLAVMGTLILGFGWFGFNAGSTLSATEPRIAEIAANTAIASATGGLTSLGYVWQRHRRPDVAMACNGFLGGLVSITGVVRVRCAAGGRSDRRRRRAARCPLGRFVSSGTCGSTTPSEPSPFTASAGHGECSPSVSWRTGASARGGTASPDPCADCSSATPASSWPRRLAS